MREIFFRKELVIGIIFLFVGASISPVLGTSLNTNLEKSDEYLSERNELVIPDEDSSEMITVTKIKLLENGFIRNVQEKISVKDYNEYVDKLSACECGDIESSFAVLKEYGIVPESMAVDKFVQIMNKKSEKFDFLINLIKQIKNKPKPREEVACFFTIAIFHIHPVSYNINIPLIYFRAFSDYGGDIDACGEFYEWDEYIEVWPMLFFLGLLVYTPYVCLIECSFAGFASFIYSSGF